MHGRGMTSYPGGGYEQYEVVDGKLNGKWFRVFGSGISYCEFLDGKEHGRYRWLNRTGELVSEDEYEQGKAIKRK